MEAKFVSITPKMAKQFLAKNTNNYRKMSEHTVKAYQAEMESGNWKENGDSIKFNESGFLVDGQHRLTAIVRSGCTIPMLVVTGISDQVNTYDIGKGRTATDIAIADGLEAGAANNVTVGSVALLLRGPYGNGASPKQQIVSILAGDANGWDTAYRSTSTRSHKNSPSRKSACVLAAYVLLKQNTPADSLREFFSIVNSGFPVEGKDCSSAIVLRNFLVSEKGKREIHTHAGRTYLFSATLSAFDDFASGSKRIKAYKTNPAHISLMKELREFVISK